MPAITILSHGTANSTNTSTSEGSELVISRIGRLLGGVEGRDWILNEGAGTDELAHQRGITPSLSNMIAGIAKGDGVEANVAKSVNFVRDAVSSRGPLTVNLAGHSRGSITCYKIASELQDWAPNVPVNIFAIDPVPGNNGSINEEMHERISLRGNVQHSFLMLAESEHRLNFRPYVDRIYSEESSAKGHKFDTMPGTHGGINMLTGNESEAAALVLSRALRFLQKHGSQFRLGVANSILDDTSALRKYSELMLRIKRYNAHATVNPLKSLKHSVGNLLTTSFNIDKHRIVNVAGSKQTWGTASHESPSPHTAGRKDHHGLGMNEALTLMGLGDPHAQRANRFFANKEHQKLFAKQHPHYIREVLNLERSSDPQSVQALQRAIANTTDHYNFQMTAATKTYFYAYCQKRGVLP